MKYFKQYVALGVVALLVVLSFTLRPLSADEGQKSTPHIDLCPMIIAKYGDLVKNLECEELAEINVVASNMDCLLLDDVACSLRETGVDFIVKLPIEHGTLVTVISEDDRGIVCSVGLEHELILLTSFGGMIVPCNNVFLDLG